MRSILKNKKAQASNIIFFTVVLFFLAMSLVTVIFVFDKIADVIKTNDALNSTSVASDITDTMDIVSSTTVDRTFAFLASILILGMMVSAFLTDRSPFWFFMYIIILAITILSAAPIANMYQRVLENPTFAASVAANQTAMNYFMTNYITIIIVASIASIVIALSKTQGVASGISDI